MEEKESYLRYDPQGIDASWHHEAMFNLRISKEQNTSI